MVTSLYCIVEGVDKSIHSFRDCVENALSNNMDTSLSSLIEDVETSLHFFR